MTEVRAVLFDLDDTLVASNEFAAGVLSAAAVAHGFELDADAVAAHPGAIYVQLLQNLIGVPEPTATEIYKTYVEQYSATMSGQLLPAPGADELITTLAERGVPLALVTNKVHSLASAILDLFGWGAAFKVIVGQGAAPRPKPNPDPALMALAALDCAPEHAAFIGDGAGDMECGLRAGVAVRVGMAGLTSADVLAAAGATSVCNDLSEVIDLLHTTD